ncbi:MAG: hypothetical protein JOZ39_08485 [Chloroflexi bacterium]|nr:hypothetical protein [Chloroflexota bacterium]
MATIHILRSLALTGLALACATPALPASAATCAAASPGGTLTHASAASNSLLPSTGSAASDQYVIQGDGQPFQLSIAFNGLVASSPSLGDIVIAGPNGAVGEALARPDGTAMFNLATDPGSQYTVTVENWTPAAVGYQMSVDCS